MSLLCGGVRLTGTFSVALPTTILGIVIAGCLQLQFSEVIYNATTNSGFCPDAKRCTSRKETTPIKFNF